MAKRTTHKRTKTKKKATPVHVVRRDEKGRFLPGHCANPLGRPKLQQTRLEQLLRSISRVETKRGRSLLDHYVQRAFENDAILINVMKKLLPDLKAISVLELDAASMDDSKAAEIRTKLRERFEMAMATLNQRIESEHEGIRVNPREGG